MKGCSCDVLFSDRKDYGSYGFAGFQLVQVELVYWKQRQTTRHAHVRSAYTLDVTVFVDGVQVAARFERIAPPISRPDAIRVAVELFDSLMAEHPVLNKKVETPE